jgi:hypothetical protein
MGWMSARHRDLIPALVGHEGRAPVSTDSDPVRPLTDLHGADDCVSRRIEHLQRSWPLADGHKARHNTLTHRHSWWEPSGPHPVPAAGVSLAGGWHASCALWAHFFNAGMGCTCASKGYG